MSSGDASLLTSIVDRPSSTSASIFFISIGESSFLLRWANIFVAEKMKTC